MNKSQFEAALNKTAIKPVYRTKIGDNEVFIADGFVPPSQLRYLDRFGMKATTDEFPFGAFATIWYAERRVGWCGLAICDAFHDAGDSADGKRKRRINSAVTMAESHFRRYAKAIH